MAWRTGVPGLCGWTTSRGPSGRVWRCGNGECRKRVSRTAGTIFQDTRTPLTVWFAAGWYMTADPGGVSALTMQKLLGLGSYQTAWAMLHRYRTAMVRPGQELLSGRVEVDETFLGGEQPGPRGRGALGKTLVVIAVELVEPKGYGRTRMSVITDASTSSLRPFLLATVEPGATVVTDGWGAYPGACQAGSPTSRTRLPGPDPRRTNCFRLCIAWRPCASAGYWARTKAACSQSTCRPTLTSSASGSTVAMPPRVASCSTGSWSTPPAHPH